MLLNWEKSGDSAAGERGVVVAAPFFSLLPTTALLLLFLRKTFLPPLPSLPPLSFYCETGVDKKGL